MSLTSELIVSEQFYSIQGEGFSAGHPAIFLRLAGCNLRCPGFSYQDPNSQEHLGCDTAAVWRQGKRQRFEDIIEHWQQEGWLDALRQGAHLVITGGEPLIQQVALNNFIDYLDLQLEGTPYLELETNATLEMNTALLQRLNQINASPKLSSNGDPRHKTYQPAVLTELAKHDKVKFKFVVQSADDVQQIIHDYIEPFNLNKNNICLMPEGGTQKRLEQTAPMVVELCKKHLLNYSPRLHIRIWDEAVGV